MTDDETNALKRLTEASQWTDRDGELLENTFVIQADLRIVLAVLDRYKKALDEIADGSAFNQQRFAEDDDTDYFMRCFGALKAIACVAREGTT